MSSRGAVRPAASATTIAGRAVPPTNRRSALASQRAAFLIEYFASHPCVDCGESDPVVLEFDHLEEKSFNIAKGLRDRSWEALVTEIAKCDVVCANCHRRRTAVRGGFARAAAARA